MIKSKKQMFLIIGVFAILLVLTTVTYAFFNYTRTGQVNELIVGKIYMNHERTSENNLHLVNIFPSDGPDLTKYYEFKVYGYNEYSKDIIYDISLVYGDLTDNTKTRIRDTDIRFTLTRVDTINDTETTLIDGKRYATLEDKRIYVDKIDKETSEDDEIEHVYRLYMWVDNSDVAITDTPEENVDWINGRDVYSTSEWNNLEASIKVKVTGDFNEKIVGTPESCFTINVLDENEHTAEITGYNGGTTYMLKSNLTESQINACATYMDNEWGLSAGMSDPLDEGETWEEFCAGTGTYWGDTFQDYLDNDWFDNYMYPYFESIELINKNIDATCGIDIEIPSTIDNYTITKIADGTYNTASFAQKFLNSVIIPDSVTAIGDYAFNSSNLTSVIIPNSVTTIGNYSFTSNELTNVILQNGLVSIGHAAFFANNLTSVTIPNSVTTIGVGAFSENELHTVVLSNSINAIGQSAFYHNQITSVIIPNGITVIEPSVFAYNQISNVVIPNSVVEIKGDNSGTYNNETETWVLNGAFANNNLVSLAIPSSVTKIGSYAFYHNQLSSINIPNSVTTIELGAFNSNNLPDNSAYIYKRNDTNNDGIAEIDITSLISYGGANKNITIPSNITTIGNNAFAFNKLTSVVFPNNITSIEKGAFSNNNLTSVSIPNTIVSIGENSFYKINISGISSNDNLESLSIDKSCSAIKSMTNYSKWLGEAKTGTTIYGSGGEVCDAY